MNKLDQNASRCNAVVRQDDPPLTIYRPTLTPGGRLIRRRTGWSASLSNAVAAAWHFGAAVEG